MITVEQRKLLAHALGGEDPSKWYRNYFVSHEGCFDWQDLCRLEKSGHMRRAKTPSFIPEGDTVFQVTDKGKNIFR